MAARTRTRKPVPALVEAEEITLSVEDARALTDAISTQATVLWDLVTTAYTQRAWVALEYASWDEYVSSEFEKSKLRLPREDRVEVIGSLRDAGLSVRAIAAATGSGIGTVHRALEEIETLSETTELDVFESQAEVEVEVEAEFVDEPAPVTGKDGKTYASTRPKQRRKARPPTGPKTRGTIDMLAVERPARADSSVFEHADDGIGYGDRDFGACIFMGNVQWYSAGSYDEITAAEARLLAACLLAAAESVEALEREDS